MPHRVSKRVWPALALVLLSPLIAEFLLGDLSVRQLILMPFFIPQYGCGALFVRELARRRQRGWPTMLLLALAYALIEEGFTTQSLFNPTYAGRRLLDYGYVSQLGTSLNWVTFVITLHVVWSIGSAIAVAEGLSGRWWNTAWLGTRGLSVAAVLFLLGCAMTTASTAYMYPYVASVGQFATLAVLVMVAIGCAFAIPRDKPKREGTAPSLWIVGVFSFLLCSAFHVVYDHGDGHQLPPSITLAGMLALEAVAVVAFIVWSRRDQWRPLHPLVAATGAILTYGWVGLGRLMLGGATALGVPATTADDAGQAALLAGIVGLTVLAARRLAADESTQPA